MKPLNILNSQTLQVAQIQPMRKASTPMSRPQTHYKPDSVLRRSCGFYVVGVSLVKGDLCSIFISLSSDAQRAPKSALVVLKFSRGAASVDAAQAVLTARARNDRALKLRGPWLGCG